MIFFAWTKIKQSFNQIETRVFRGLLKIPHEVLKRTGQGRWSASKVKENRLQVKCSVHDPELARAQIKQALSKHWIVRHLLSG